MTDTDTKNLESLKRLKMDFHFTLSVCILCMSFLPIVSSRATGQGQNPKQQFISYLNKDGNSRQCAKERVMVTDTEARFDVKGGISYVFDYELHQLVFQEKTKGAPCYLYTGLDTATIPSLDELKNLLAENNVFSPPTERKEIRLQTSAKQLLIRPNLSPISQKLCQNSQIVLLEPKVVEDEGVTAVAARRLRPKREVGWGEVCLIIIVVIILL